MRCGQDRGGRREKGTGREGRLPGLCALLRRVDSEPGHHSQARVQCNCERPSGPSPEGAPKLPIQRLVRGCTFLCLKLKQNASHMNTPCSVTPPIANQPNTVPFGQEKGMSPSGGVPWEGVPPLRILGAQPLRLAPSAPTSPRGELLVNWDASPGGWLPVSSSLESEWLGSWAVGPDCQGEHPGSSAHSLWQVPPCPGL